MALRIQVIDSSKHPEAFYESMAIVSYCNNEIDKMKDYSQRASQKFGELAKQSSGNQKAIYIQRQIDTNILNSNYQKADSLYLLLRTLDSKNYCLNFDCYYKEVRSNLEELKQQYNECGE